MTTLKDEELPALPEVSYEIHLVDFGGQPNAAVINEVGRLMKDYGRRCQREAIAHGVAMERKHADVIRAHLDTVRFHLTRDDFRGSESLRHEALDCIEAALAHEAKRRQG